ncbi:MAG: neocarzinostatin apoprotein domain-containing protein [Acidimicrobiia bacterium]
MSRSRSLVRGLLLTATVAVALVAGAARVAGADDGPGVDTSTTSTTTPTTTTQPVTPSATPTLTATPLTGLHQMSYVHFNGTGFAPSEVIGSPHECVTGGGCDPTVPPAGVAPVAADAAGAVVDWPAIVHREINVGGSPVVCDAAPGTCSVQVGSWEFPIAFALPRELVEISPTTDLVDGGQVTVTASNFEPARYVLTTQCATADGDSAHCWATHAVVYAQVGADGTFVRTGQVTRFLPTSAGTVDCAAQTCYLVSEDVVDWAHRWTVPIQVKATPTTTTTEAPGGVTLPRTGGPNGMLALSGLLTVLVGSALVVSARRRSR